MKRLKHNYLILILAVAGLQSQAQSPTTDAGTAITAANSAKTGNLQDIFTNSMLLSLENLTGPDKSFEFSSSLFALKARLDPSIKVDTNYIHHAFDRNFQFGGRINLNQNFSIRGFGAGLTYALINKRDSTVLSYVGGPVDNASQTFNDTLQRAVARYRFSLMRDDGNFISHKDSLEYMQVHAKINELLDQRVFKVSDLPSQIRLSPGAIAARQYADSVFLHDLERTRLKPLLTFSMDGNYNTTTEVVDKAAFNLTYLQGVTGSGRPLELDIRATLQYFDTIATVPNQRLHFGFNAGANWALLYSKKTKITFLEVKPSFEYVNVLDGVLPGEESTKFFANAELRLRITKDIWFPIGIKYDIENENFLGFLSVSYNFDVFKEVLGHNQLD